MMMGHAHARDTPTLEEDERCIRNMTQQHGRDDVIVMFFTSKIK